MRWLWVTLFLFVFLAGCSDEPTEPSLTSGVNLLYSRNIQVALAKGTGPTVEHVAVEGWLINIGDVPADSVRASIRFYRADSSFVTGIIDYVTSPIAPKDSSQVYFYADWDTMYHYFELSQVTWTE